MAKYFVLNPAEEAALLKTVRGVGGFQSLMRRLQKSYRRGSNELPIPSDHDTELIQRYAFDYEQGGFEEDLMAIFARHLGPTLGRES